MPEVSDMFATLEDSKKAYLDTRHLEAETVRKMGPHLVKLPKGVMPTYIKLTPYQQFCWKTMGKMVKVKYKENQALEEKLLKAHMKIRPEEFIATVWMTAIFAAVGAIAAGGIIGVVLGMLMGPVGYIFSPIIIVLIPVMVYFMMMMGPGSKAKARGHKIDKRISATMSFISAMASANVNIDVIFKELSRQEQYGEIREEAEWITRDTELLGYDILTAIKRAADRTPSQKFQDFLQGVVTTSTSGGELKPYFLLKAEQYEKDNKLELKSQMETLGMLAESFVTVGVAFPLFLVVILSIMSIISGSSGGFILNMLYLVVVAMIPGVQFGFIVGLSAVMGSED